jgi:hypothetical protein
VDGWSRSQGTEAVSLRALRCPRSFVIDRHLAQTVGHSPASHHTSHRPPSCTGLARSASLRPPRCPPAAAAAAGPLPDDHPAAALWWRILDQLPETPNQHPATLRQSQQPGTRPPSHPTSSHPGHARRRHPRSVRAAENVDASQCRRSVSRSLLPNPSTDRGRLVRGGAWHFVRYRGYDISVIDGSARRSRQLPGVPLTCTSPTYPQGVRP